MAQRTVGWIIQSLKYTIQRGHQIVPVPVADLQALFDEIERLSVIRPEIIDAEVAERMKAQG